MFRDVHDRKAKLEQDIISAMLPEFTKGNVTLRSFIGPDLTTGTAEGVKRFRQSKALKRLARLERDVDERQHDLPKSAYYDADHIEALGRAPYAGRASSPIGRGGAKNLRREREKREVARELAALGIRSSSDPYKRPKETRKRKRGTYEQRQAYENVLLRTPEEQAKVDAADAAAVERDRTKKRKRRSLNETERWVQKNQDLALYYNPLLEEYERYPDKVPLRDYIAAQKAKPRSERDLLMKDLASELADTAPRDEEDEYDDEEEPFIAPSDSDATEGEDEEPDEEALAVIAYNLRQKRKTRRLKKAKQAAFRARVEAGLEPDYIVVPDEEKTGSGRPHVIRAWWW